MGCTSSISLTTNSCRQFQNYSGQVKSRITLGTRHPIKLTSLERHTVRRTWPALSKDLQGNGLQVFLRIFELCPEAKALFSVENVRHSELARNVNIKAHGSRFISAISEAVDNLDEFDKEDNKLSKRLFVLGQQHTHFKGFRPEYFDIFYEALMWQWERCMGKEFTSEVSDTWSHVFVYIMQTLKNGYYSNDEIFKTKGTEQY